MKFCKDCAYHKRVPIQAGNQMTMADVCMHDDFRDPVHGGHMPCAISRQEKSLCGWEGRGFLSLPLPKEESKILV